jgi:hypothetical protein
MTVPARRSRASLAESDDDFDGDFAPGEFYSGERICPSPEGMAGGGLLRGLILIAIALGGGWALMSYPAAWRPWLAAGIAAVSAAVDARAPAPVEATAAAAVAPPLPAATIIPTIQQAAVAPPPPDPQPAASAAETQTAATTDAIAPAVEEPPAQRLPPPVVDPLDPYQKRAAAVGLHPQLSRVLLARLSPTDYRNAGVAIETAVAKTPDTATFVWPRQRTPELALFQVHFVPGAAPHCRRYVVTVTKDRWSTTAAPMEKCGSKLAGGKSK